MKIVNLEEFMRLPAGTVYSEYERLSFFNELYVKIKNVDVPYPTWEYQRLLDCVDANDYCEMTDILFDAEEKGTKFKMDLDCIHSKGVYDNKQKLLFAIYDKDDLERLIQKLQNVAKGILY